MPDRNPDRVDADAGQPGEVLLGDEAVPMPFQCLFGTSAQFDAERGFVLGLQAFKQTRRHPFFNYQPTA